MLAGTTAVHSMTMTSMLKRSALAVLATMFAGCAERVTEDAVEIQAVNLQTTASLHCPPPESLVRPVSATEAEAAVAEVLSVFAPIVELNYNKELEPVFQWESSAKSSSPQFRNGKWRILYRGGLLNQYLSRDLVHLITCHELGHFLGGFPMRETVQHEVPEHEMTIFASEGQADYFAGKDCLSRVWANDETNGAYAAVLSPGAIAGCDEQWGTWGGRREICYRTVATAQRLALWLDGSIVDVTDPDPAPVSTTFRGHSSPLCRFQTFAAGAVCDQEQDLAVVPGLIPDPDTSFFGYQFQASEQHAAPYACHGDDPGARPACWFVAGEPDSFEREDLVYCPELGYEYGETRCEGDNLVTCSPVSLDVSVCPVTCDPEILDCIYE